MRRWKWLVAAVLVFSLVLAGCGKKDAAAVVNDLDNKVKELSSYHATGVMTLQTGMEPQEYAVEVCYMAPSYYRISLTNEKKDITQIVLRNDDGVFVLTPHLNKSFRFQSNWPENQGQVYLYQSLIQSILMDEERQFLDDEKGYVFDVAANYQNGSLARQKVWLDKKTYSPQHVEVSDSNGNVLVIVKFNEFEFGTKFEKDQFDMERNMTSWNLQSTLPTAAEATGEQPQGKTAGEGHDHSEHNKASSITDDAGASSSAQPAEPQTFGIIEPSYIPEGVALKDINQVNLGEDKGIMLRYSGTYNYSLVEAWPTEKAVSLPLPGTPVDLGFTLGVLTGEELRTLIWTYEGVEFRLSTGDLPLEEMIKVAQAVQGEMGK